MYLRVQSDRVDRLIEWIKEWIKITISSKIKSGNPSGNPFLSRRRMYLRVIFWSSGSSTSVDHGVDHDHEQLKNEKW